MTVEILTGDCRDVLKTLPAASVHCIVTSPPYFGLRDYGVDGQMGLEPTPDEFVAALVGVLREARRVLRDDGTLWLNLGDSFAGSGKGAWNIPDDEKKRRGVKEAYRPNFRPGSGRADGVVDARGQRNRNGVGPIEGCKPKDLIGIPWRVAFALQADGWYLRQDIIWHKPNPMPESVRDRCTKAHEYIFMLSKSPRYYYDADAIKEPSVYAPGKTTEVERPKGYYGGKWSDKQAGHGRRHAGFNERWKAQRNDGSFKAIRETRNKRSVWTVAPKPFKEAHFATFPPDLIEPCVLAGCPVGGTVLDPFFGAGTTGLVAERTGRSAIGIEINPEYVEIARRRLGLNDVSDLTTDKEGIFG